MSVKSMILAKNGSKMTPKSLSGGWFLPGKQLVFDPVSLVYTEGGPFFFMTAHINDPKIDLFDPIFDPILCLFKEKNEITNPQETWDHCIAHKTT
jgi:hypothetical protein